MTVGGNERQTLDLIGDLLNCCDPDASSLVGIKQSFISFITVRGGGASVL